MKSLTRLIPFFFPLCMLVACSKDAGRGSITPIDPPGTPVTNPPSPLAGREFVFDDLPWNYYNSGFGAPWDEIYVTSPARPDLFVNTPGLNYNNLINAEVSIKIDPSANYIPVRSQSAFDPNLSLQYTYVIVSPHLIINVSPLRPELIGRRATIRVRFN